MKIFHIITSLKIGGAETALLNFLKNSPNNNHIVAYFYPGPNLSQIKKLGIKTYQIQGLISKYDFIALYRLKKIIKNNKPDIIHSSLWSANVFSKIIANKLKIPVVCDLHSNFIFDGKIRKFIEQFILKADNYVAVSNSVKLGFLKTFKMQAEQLKNKTVVIKNGIDFKHIHESIPFSKYKLGFKSNDFIIGAVGRLEKIKSYDLLIKSFYTACKYIEKNDNLKKLKENKKTIKLCIVGNGSQLKFLKKLVSKLDIEDKVVFTGAIKNPNKIYPIFDCFVISSKSEGLSIALLEAMSHGLPIITTSQTETHDILKHNLNGLIVQPGKQKALSGAIEKIYFDPKLIKKMGVANKNLIRQNFSINHLVDKYEKLFQTLKNQFYKI